MAIYCGTWADWIQAIATAVLCSVALVALIYAKKQLGALKDSAYQQRLSTLMSEITGDEVGNDRGLVRKLTVDAGVWRIKQHVVAGRKLTAKLRKANLTQTKANIGDNEFEIGLIGVAIEKTIMRYDRVALLVLKNKDKFQLTPPDWVLADVNMIWSRLRKWVDFRRTTDDEKFKDSLYAKDLELLFNHPATRRLKDVNPD